MTTDIVGPIFSEKGGVPYDERTFRNEALRADLVEAVGHHCFQHASAIVEEILNGYDVCRVFK